METLYRIRDIKWPRKARFTHTGLPSTLVIAVTSPQEIGNQISELSQCWYDMQWDAYKLHYPEIMDMSIIYPTFGNKYHITYGTLHIKNWDGKRVLCKTHQPADGEPYFPQYIVFERMRFLVRKSGIGKVTLKFWPKTYDTARKRWGYDVEYAEKLLSDTK